MIVRRRWMPRAARARRVSVLNSSALHLLWYRLRQNFPRCPSIQGRERRNKRAQPRRRVPRRTRLHRSQGRPRRETVHLLRVGRRVREIRQRFQLFRQHPRLGHNLCRVVACEACGRTRPRKLHKTARLCSLACLRPTLLYGASSKSTLPSTVREMTRFARPKGSTQSARASCGLSQPRFAQISSIVGSTSACVKPR